MKYIIFDMDDTLLRSDKTISDFTLLTLKKIQDLGNVIVMNTARSKSFNQEYFDLVKPDYAILNGGSLIIDKNEDILYKENIDKETVNKLTKKLLKKTRTFSVYTDKKLYSSDPHYHGQNAVFFDFINYNLNLDASKIVASFLPNVEGNKVVNKYGLIYVPYMDGRFGRINLKSTSKENGNKILMNLLNKSLDDCIVFGDDYGDLKMIQDAGIGVLMKNANPKFYKEARYITKFTNDEDGVAKFLTEYFDI